jgi:hypothetical protein
MEVVGVTVCQRSTGSGLDTILDILSGDGYGSWAGIPEYGIAIEAATTGIHGVGPGDGYRIVIGPGADSSVALDVGWVRWRSDIDEERPEVDCAYPVTGIIHGSYMEVVGVTVCQRGTGSGLNAFLDILSGDGYGI